MSRQTLLSAFRIIATVGLLALLFARVEVAVVGRALRQASPGWVALALALYLVAIGTNTLKWGVLLRAQGVQVPWSALARYTFVGLFFNNLLPAAVGGDLLRGYGVARYTQRAADAAVSVVVDRLVGLTALAGSAVVAVLVAQAQEAAGGADLARTFWLAIGLTVALAGSLLAMVSRRVRRGVGGALDAAAARLPLARPFVAIYHKLAEAVGAYRHQPGTLLLALAIALGTWLLSNGVNYALSLSLVQGAPSPNAPISLLHIFIFNPLVGLSQLLPLSIGGLGLNQNLYDAFYHQLLGYDQPHVVAVSFLMQLVVYLTSLPGGLLWSYDRSRARGERAAPPQPDRASEA